MIIIPSGEEGSGTSLLIFGTAVVLGLCIIFMYRGEEPKDCIIVKYGNKYRIETPYISGPMVHKYGSIYNTIDEARKARILCNEESVIHANDGEEVH